MPNIDYFFVTANDNSTANATRNFTVQNKQAWLQTLEKVGLSKTLQEIRVIQTVNRQLTKPQLDGFINVGSPPITNKEDDGANPHLSVVPHQNEEPIAIKTRSQQEVLQADAAIDELQHTSMNTHSLVFESNGLADNPRLRLLTRGASSVTFALDSLQYPLQSTLILRSDVGVEIWIRDLSLSKSRLTELLRNVRQAMGALGASLARVVLNGQDVFSSQLSGEINPHNRGV